MAYKDTRTWRDKYDASKKYEDKNVVRKTFKLYKKSDADIIEAIESASEKAEFLRNAIRFYVANGCPVPEVKEVEGEQE